MSVVPKRGRKQKNIIGSNNDIRFDIERFGASVCDTIAVFLGSEVRKWSLKKEWAEFTKIYFEVSRPRERYIRSSYDYFRNHENIIMSVHENKLDQCAVLPHPNELVNVVTASPGEYQIFDSGSAKKEQILENDAQKPLESSKRPSKVFSTITSKESKGMGPYFNFPRVKNIEGSIFLINCEGARIIERDRATLNQKQVNAFEAKENESVILDENTGVNTPLTDSTASISSSNNKNLCSIDGMDAHLDTTSDPIPSCKKNSLEMNETSDSHKVMITVDRQFSVKLNESEWQDIYSLCTTNKNKQKVLPRNWVDHVARFLSKRIPHCNIKFKRHKIYSICSNYVAKFWLNCGIEGCTLDGNAVLDKNTLLHVNNLSTSLTHTKGKPKSFRSRFIRGDERLKLCKTVSDTGFPSKEFHKRLSNLDEDSFNAGNLKDTPVSKNVLKQCL